MTTATFSAADGTRLGYAVHGSGGPWLVLCHALLATSAQWAPQIEALSRHFRVVTPDTRGHGASAATPAPYDLDLLADDLLALFDALAIDKAHLLGASMNGLVAQVFAARNPERVERLVLANTTWRYGPETRDGWNKRIETAEAGALAAVVDGTLERFLTAEFRAANPTRVAPLRAAMTAVEVQGFVGCCTALRDADIGETHARLTMPVLAIAGASDIATTPAIMEGLVARLSDARLAVISGAHLCNFESPDAFNSVLVEGLTDAR